MKMTVVLTILLSINAYSDSAFASASGGPKQAEMVTDYYGAEQVVECLEGYKCPQSNNSLRINQTHNINPNSFGDNSNFNQKNIYNYQVLNNPFSPVTEIELNEMKIKIFNSVNVYIQNGIKLNLNGVKFYVSNKIEQDGPNIKLLYSNPKNYLIRADTSDLGVKTILAMF